MIQNYIQKTKDVFVALIVIPVLCMIFPLYGFAEEIRYPILCYEEDELEKVREWEKQWVGKKIDHTNVDGVKEFLPESLYDVYKNPDIWGENSFVIGPYKQLKIPPTQVEWTLKQVGKATIDNEDYLQNHVAGTPFPNPKTGLEVMYNFDTKPTLDERQQWMDNGFVYDHRRKNMRTFSADVHVLQVSERTTTPPMPELPGNARGIHRASLVFYVTPPEIKGLAILVHRYKDRSKQWDGWMWIAPLRRVRRQDTTQRQDHRSGMDFCSDDQNGWDGRVPRNTYKLLGRQEVLMGRHNIIEDIHAEKGKILWQGLNRERVKAYVIEVVSKDPTYLYSKSVFWYDPEAWFILYTDKYDRLGRLWKINDYCLVSYTSKVGIEYSEKCTNLHTDIQRKHSTLARGIDKDLTGVYGMDHYTPAELERIGR